MTIETPRNHPKLRIDASLCIRCGAGASHAIQLIAIGPKSAFVVAQPQTPEEQQAAREATLLCPVGAVSYEE